MALLRNVVLSLSVVWGAGLPVPVVGALLMGLPGPAVAQSLKPGPSGLPLPRFVSLGAGQVNVRRGPGQQYDIAWEFRRSGLPVEIVQEFDNWRKIRDADGDEGWVFHSLLSGKRTAIVAPWAENATFALKTQPAPETATIAYLETNVVAEIIRCDGKWCRVRGTGFDGWMEQDELWGVYPDETVEDR